MEVLLYSAKGSNSSERVEWVLKFKRIHFDRIEVSSSELATTYLDINPFGYVPSLSVDGSVFSESMAIIEYLEERFPKPTLFGKNLDEKTHIRRVCEYVNTSIHSPQNRTVLKFMHPELDEMSKRELRGDWIMRCLEKLSMSICRESGFAVGNSFSVADIFVASIYKKALQHDCVKNDFYDKHLMYVRANESALVSEPHA
ncbi:glutathione S-transferase family protein [Vibrio lentus]